MSVVIAFWLGGAVANAMLLAAEAHADDEVALETGEIMLMTAGWPLMCAMFLYDVLRGWRA